MFNHSLRLFFRNFLRHKLFSIINILGLTVSISFTILIYLYVSHEFSYDSMHLDANRIYRVNQTFIWGENNSNQFASTGPGVVTAIRQEIPEAELITSIHTPGNFIVSVTTPENEIRSFEEQEVLAADSNFFKMFSFKLLKGNANTALSHLNTVVLTESTARKYFGTTPAIGQLMRFHKNAETQSSTYEVTGIVADPPDNSYLQFDMLLSTSGFGLDKLHWSWVWTQLETYIRLTPLADPDQVRAKLEKLPPKYAGETLRLAFNTTWEEYTKSGKKWELFLQPLLTIHLPEVPVINRISESGSMVIIWSFIGAAIFIVLLSCINFINLTTAQFTRRIKEIGVRKILGMGKSELARDQMLNAFLFCLLAVILGLGLSQLLLPAFNWISGKNLQLDLFLHSDVWLSLTTLIILMAVLSGSYPAYYLSKYSASDAVKGKIKTGNSGMFFRNGLVVVQFTISITLIICTVIVYQQLQHIATKDLGFKKDNILVLNHGEMIKEGEAMTNELTTVPGVLEASQCSSVPPRIWGGDTFGAEGNLEVRFPLNFLHADEHFIPMLDIKLIAGRNFQQDNPGDGNRVIVNEAALQRIGWKTDDSVIGKRIFYGDVPFEIAGVVSNFNYWTLASPIEPLAIFHLSNKEVYAGNSSLIAMRINTQTQADWNNLLASLTSIWKTHANGTPFDYFFIDEAFSETFRVQERFGHVLTAMAFVSILIASLGLLGIIVYALEQRTKEIGIRKVSGASVFDILFLVSRSYTLLIALAFIIGSGFSWWLMSKWLADFAYRVTPSIGTFLSCGLITLVISILITGYHSWKAANRNPIDVLKDD